MKQGLGPYRSSPSHSPHRSQPKREPYSTRVQGWSKTILPVARAMSAISRSTDRKASQGKNLPLPFQVKTQEVRQTLTSLPELTERGRTGAGTKPGQDGTRARGRANNQGTASWCNGRLDGSSNTGSSYCKRSKPLSCNKSTSVQETECPSHPSLNPEGLANSLPASPELTGRG